MLGRHDGRGDEEEVATDEKEEEEGGGGEVDARVGVPGSGTEVSSERRDREETSRERERGHKSRQSYGLKEAYWLASRDHPAADAFAEEPAGRFERAGRRYRDTRDEGYSPRKDSVNLSSIMIARVLGTDTPSAEYFVLAFSVRSTEIIEPDHGRKSQSNDHRIFKS